MNLELAIRLDDANAAYAPGASVEGEWTIGAFEQWKADFVHLMVGWRTEGRGDQDQGLAARDEIYGKDHLVPSYDKRRFAIRLPDLPWTYHGRMIKIHWSVILLAKADGEKEIFAEVPIIVHPQPESFGRANNAAAFTPEGNSVNAAWGRT